VLKNLSIQIKVDAASWQLSKTFKKLDLSTTKSPKHLH